MKLVLTSFAVTLAILSSVCFVSGLDAEDKSLPITIVSHVDIKPDAYTPQAEENSWRLFRAETAATNFRSTVDIKILDHPVTTSTVPVGAWFRAYNAWPTAVSWSDLDAGANALFINQMSLAHEGFDVAVATTVAGDITTAPV